MKMKFQIYFRITVCLLLASTLVFCGKKSESADSLKDGKNNFDYDWKFLLDSVEGGENPVYADSLWRTVDLPHDWSIEDLDKQKHPDAIGPFSKESPGATSTGHVLGGTAWYRKHFTLDDGKDKVVTISFDGVYMLSEVWVNGKPVGKNNYGYSPFNFDISPLLNEPGKENVIAVRVKNPGKNSRWYSGSGIYRHVWLNIQNPVHIPVWGVYVATPRVNKEKALITIQTKIKNTAKEKATLSLATKIVDKSGNTVAENARDTLISSGSESTLNISLTVTNPVLWACESPEMYTAIQTITIDGKVVDTKETPFGIRSISFSSNEGFLLNGVETKLYGGCMHHDNGILGSATFDDAEMHRIKAMKDNGFNAIRTSHNPPSQQFLDACDRLGMLVIDEAFDMWERPKNPQDYHLFFNNDAKKDLEAMILRDRNHPSVIIWSIGNEINERADTSGVRIGKWLKGIVKSLDETRPVTAAICFFWDHPTYTWKNSIPAFEILDVHGYNYQWLEYENDTKNFPGRIIMGTETFPFEALENYKLMEKNKNVIGEFVWTGTDYLGESGIGHFYQANEKSEFSMPYPYFNGWCGDIDVIGNKKMQSYYRDVVWRRSKLEIAVHSPLTNAANEKISLWGWPNDNLSWNWEGNEGKKIQVKIYSRCEKVKLELNGKTIGEKKLSRKDNLTPSFAIMQETYMTWLKSHDELTAVFDVPYEAGELKATGYENGKVVAEKIIKTTGKPSKIKLIAEQNTIKASKSNLAYFRLEVTDKEGNLVPLSSVPVSFEIVGEATLAAAGTACPNCMESFTDNKFTTFNGLGMIILRSNGKGGKIRLQAESKGLESAITDINVE